MDKPTADKILPTPSFLDLIFGAFKLPSKYYTYSQMTLIRNSKGIFGFSGSNRVENVVLGLTT